MKYKLTLREDNPFDKGEIGVFTWFRYCQLTLKCNIASVIYIKS